MLISFVVPKGLNPWKKEKEEFGRRFQVKVSTSLL